MSFSLVSTSRKPREHVGFFTTEGTETTEKNDLIGLNSILISVNSVVRLPVPALIDLQIFRISCHGDVGQYPSYFKFNGFFFLLATGYEKLINKIRLLNFPQGWISRNV